MRGFLRLPFSSHAAGRRPPLWVVPVALVLLALACSRGAYPLDPFPEMHYQSSIRAQEPPRKAPPLDSVPRTGKEVAYDFGAAANLTNPVPRTQGNMDRANKLYQVNCSMCHGSQGRGDGPLAPRFQAANAPVPVDFSQARTKGRSAGQLWWIITNGLGNMPPWKALLTEEERWLLVLFVQGIQ